MGTSFPFGHKFRLRNYSSDFDKIWYRKIKSKVDIHPYPSIINMLYVNFKIQTWCTYVNCSAN
jgi:hypothetical protein